MTNFYDWIILLRSKESPFCCLAARGQSQHGAHSTEHGSPVPPAVMSAMEEASAEQPQPLGAIMTRFVLQLLQLNWACSWIQLGPLPNPWSASPSLWPCLALLWFLTLAMGQWPGLAAPTSFVRSILTLLLHPCCFLTNPELKILQGFPSW